LTTYCSNTCRAATSGKQVEADCPTCGKRYKYFASWPKLFCSQACYSASRYKGGKVYYGGNWVKQRARAIVRDGGCVDCGAIEPLHVHHLVAAREFDGDWVSANNLDNLVTVCPDCHLARHGGRY
jgi:hypothetical protein